MAITLSDEARRCLAAFEAIAGVSGIDCVIDETFDRVVIVVATGQIADAIGPQGQTVERVESRLDRSVTLIEDADTPEDFVANALRPAAVYDVDLKVEDGDTIAVAEVPSADRGAAIGADGQTIELAKTLAKRHFDIDDIRLSSPSATEGDV